MNELFIERLRLAIKESGLRQKEFAANSGISAGYLTDILKGRTTPSERVVKNICAGNSLNESWLLSAEGEMRPAREASEGEALHRQIAELVRKHAKGWPEARDVELTPREVERELAIRTLPEDKRQTVDNIINAFLAEERAKRQDSD